MTRGMYGGERSSRRPYGTAVWMWAPVSQDFILGYFRFVPTGRGSGAMGESARHIGATRQEVNRITTLKHATKIDHIDAALTGIG